MATVNEEAVYILVNKKLLVDCHDIRSIQPMRGGVPDLYAVQMSNGELWQVQIDQESMETYNNFLTKRSEEG